MKTLKALSPPHLWWAVALIVSFPRPGGVSDSVLCSWCGQNKITQTEVPRALLCVALCSAQKAMPVFVFRTICVEDSMKHERNKTQASHLCVFCAAEWKIWLQTLPLPRTSYLTLANHLIALTSVSLPEKRR